MRRALGVAGIVVLGMSGCAAPAPAVTALGEILFKSAPLGFSIAYPAGWEKVESLGQDGGGTIAFVAPPRPTDAAEGAPRGTVGVTVQPLAPKDAASPAAFAQWYLRGFQQRWPDATVLSQSSVVIRGRPAAELVLTKPDTDPHGHPFTVKIQGVFFVQGARGYLVYYNHDASRFGEAIAARQRLLDTFRITAS